MKEEEEIGFPESLGEDARRWGMKVYHMKEFHTLMGVEKVNDLEREREFEEIITLDQYSL